MAGRWKLVATSLLALGACGDDDKPSNGQLAARVDTELAEGLRSCDLLSGGEIHGLFYLGSEPRALASCVSQCYSATSDNCAELELLYCDNRLSDRLEDCLAECGELELRCTTGGGSYRVRDACDSVPDCEDRSDEQGCLLITGYCDDGQGIIGGNTSVVCDGYEDCDDGSDEAGCPEPVYCENGESVAPWYVCDGNADCSDGADEENCNQKGYFECEDGQYRVPREFVCDLSEDCLDGSDEQQGCAELTCPAPGCTGDDINPVDNPECFADGDGFDGDGFDGDGFESDGFTDGGFVCNDGTDIPDSYLCDEINDCSSAEDEQDCPEQTYSCDGFIEYVESEWCDGVVQCRDSFADESGCGFLPTEFECADGTNISIDAVCDDASNCTGGEDESSTYCDQLPTGFDCGDGITVPESSVCDTIIDCANGSDEAGVGCGAYACGDGQYTDVDLTCDGTNDCDNGADEADCL